MIYVLTHVWAILSLLATGIFAGAAIYITFVEHPARMACSNSEALAQWRPSYRRATKMQASLAIVGTVTALLAWWGDGGVLFLLAAVLLGAVVPFTLIVIFPTNRKLEDPKLDVTAPQTRELLLAWGRLHAVRTGLSALSFVLQLVQAVWLWG